MFTASFLGDIVVIGVRVPKWARDELKRFNIDYSKEIRKYLIKRIKEERAKKILKEINLLRKRSGG